jgi:hypothetical protein
MLSSKKRVVIIRSITGQLQLCIGFNTDKTGSGKSPVKWNYFLAAPAQAAGSHFFPSTEAIPALHVAGSHLPSLHLAGSHPAALHIAGSQAFTSVVLAVLILAHVAADGHLPQAADISVVAGAFFTSCVLFCALATIITTNATTNIPDKPRITFFISLIV